MRLSKSETSLCLEERSMAALTSALDSSWLRFGRATAGGAAGCEAATGTACGAAEVSATEGAASPACTCESRVLWVCDNATCLESASDLARQSIIWRRCSPHHIATR